MTYSVLIFAFRKPGITPEQFKKHYEESHVPLVRQLAGALFPLSHTRRYIHRSETAAGTGTVRNPSTPATVLIGSQEEFDYDAFAELTFEDAGAFQTFFGHMQQPDIAAKIAEDEDEFLDRARMTVVVLGETIETKRA
ncbi:EthD domain-containing protein [Poronia punctata]|nr:EthD domain-containing protein [Poronia punctata]